MKMGGRVRPTGRCGTRALLLSSPLSLSLSLSLSLLSSPLFSLTSASNASTSALAPPAPLHVVR